MKKSILILFVLASAYINAQSTWKVDAGHSSINFAVSHLVISETTGSFDKFDIQASTGDEFSNPEFTVSIETASINTKNSRRDNHLRADDFFAAEKHPAITFKSSTYKKTGAKTFTVSGNITIKGVTKQVQFNGKLNGILKNDRGEKAGLKLTTTILREEFGIGVGSSSIGKEVEVTINLEMAKQ
ncbi:polyisoprenoid-binding protein [Leptobacterium flavescens]|uniref:Polyisoprenoid-binding protein n=1 Tax=Leptobacterium flavescens TaxID=472055 RepID=A0A6P0US58_9FLAO|nr:YceI family protein [Leptobacterium flavescens]NER15362.1 polyisoprenoid-binding protein [Leptobacterium flavescens]